MNRELYNDWARKRMSAMNYRMDKIRRRKNRRSNIEFKVIVPASLIFVTLGGLTLGQFAGHIFVLGCCIIAIGTCVLMFLDDADNKKSNEILSTWGNWTDVRLLPPSIRDTLN